MAAASSGPAPGTTLPPNYTEQWGLAVKAVQTGRFHDAIAPLDGISKKAWELPQGEKATVLLVESYLQTHNNKKALWLSKRFLDCKPGSAFRDRVETEVALLKIQESNVYGGMDDLLRILSYSKNPTIKARAKDAALQVLATSLLASGELANLLSERSPTDTEILGYLHFQLGREHQSEGRYKAARIDYGNVQRIYPGSQLAEAAGKGLSALEGQGNGTPTVLVLAPLSGEFAEFGGRMVQGVVLAHEEYSKHTGKKILLQIVDDRADPVRAIHRVQDIIATDDIVGIVGPMMSPAATAVGAWLAKTHPEIVMITPTATDEGIASLGQNIFQLNVPTASLARSIAEYAIHCFGAKDFAILTPVSDYGRVMTQVFTKAVEAGGGQVLAVQQYQEGAADYKTEFNRVRARKLSLDNRRRNIAKGLEDPSSFNPRDRKEYMEDSLISFDAIFVAASDPTDASAMASHIAFNKLGGHLLGSSGWYGRGLLADGKHLVDNSYFSVPFTETAEDASFKNFAKVYSARWEGQQPDKDRVSGLSYDAMRIFLEGWQKSDGQNTAALIHQQKTFPGVYGTYQFDAQGANSAQHILTVQKGKFLLADKCPTK